MAEPEIQSEKIAAKTSILKQMGMVSLSEGAEKFYGTMFTSIGIVGAVIAFFWGIYEFKIGKEREYEKEIFLEQVKIMNEVVDVTSTLASYPEKDSKFTEAAIHLEKLRAGRLYLFSDSKLDEMMAEFFADFNSYTANPPGVDQHTLQMHSSKISRYCKQKIKELTKLSHE